MKQIFKMIPEAVAWLEQQLIDKVDELLAEQRRKDRIREAGGCPECGQYIGGGRIKINHRPISEDNVW